MKGFAKWCRDRPASWWQALARGSMVGFAINLLVWTAAVIGGDRDLALYEFIMMVWAAFCVAINEYNFSVASARERALRQSSEREAARE